MTRARALERCARHVVRRRDGCIVVVVVTAVGCSGIYAVLTDRAKTGDVNVNTGERARAADLRIASAGAPGTRPEESFGDNIEGPQLSLNDIQPDSASGVSLCRGRRAGPGDGLIDASDRNRSCL
jgi:hypothetical protein